VIHRYAIKSLACLAYCAMPWRDTMKSTSASDTWKPSAADNAALDDLRREFGDRWDIAKITVGYRAIPRDSGRYTPIPRYGRTPAELAESIRTMEPRPVTRWDVFTGRASLPPGMLAELSQLRAALPGYDVTVTSHSLTYRFEAILRHTDGPGPWCLISTDSADLWRELAPSTQHSANTSRAAARAP
jgi:hypothetical protein